MKKLTILFALTGTLLSYQASACTSNLKSFPFECQLQDQYQALKSEFKNKFNTDIEMLAHYRAMRFLDIYDWKETNKQGNYLPWKIYKPTPKTWMYFERGAEFITTEWIEKIRGNISQKDLEEAHAAVMTRSIMGKAARGKKNAVVGEFRYKAGQKSPSWKARCNSRYGLTFEEFKVMKNFDLRSVDGRPLVYFKGGKYKKCSNGRYAARMVYLPSSDVAREISRLTDFLNQNWPNIKNGHGKISPLDMSADSQRWLVSIHPIGDGNGRISRMLQDAIAQDFGLPFAPAGYLTWDQTKPKMKYRQHVKEQYSRMMVHLESCIDQYRAGAKIHPHCRPLYSVHNNGDAQKVQAEKVQFAGELKEFLLTPESELKSFYRKYKHLDGVKNDNL